MKELAALVLTFMMLWSSIFTFPSNLTYAEEVNEKAISYVFIPEEFSKDLQKNMTKEEFCLVAVETYTYLMGKINDKTPTIDIPETSPFKDSKNPNVLQAYALGILPPNDDGTFNPTEPITLQEKATILYKIMLLIDPRIDDKVPRDANFSDESQIAPWAQSAINYLTEKQIIAPDDNNAINPTELVTREASNETTADVVTHMLNLDGTYEALDKEIQYDFIPDSIEAMGQQYITRQQFCEVMISYYKYFQNLESGKSLKPIGMPEKNPFLDTNNSFVLNAYALGIIAGDPSGNFRPNDPLTIQEKAVMLYKTMLLIKPDLVDDDPIAIDAQDASEIRDWAMKAMDFLVDNGIMDTNDADEDADTDNAVNPDDSIRIAESNEMTAEAVDVLLANVGAESVPKEYLYLLNGYHVIKKGPITPMEITVNNRILDPGKAAKYFEGSSLRETVIYDQVSNSVYKLFSDFNSSMEADYEGVLFSGSVKADYSISSTLDKNDYLVKHSELHPYNQVFLNCSDDVIKNELLSDTFKNDLDSMEPKKLFNKYGTHLIKRYLSGGRLEMNFRFNNESKMTISDITMAADASYKGYKGKIDIELQKKIDTLVSNSVLHFKAIGGDGISGNNVTDLNGQYDAWLKSLEDTSKQEICYVSEFENSMLPLWELTKDAKRAKDLKDEFDTYIPTAQSMINGLDYVEKPSPKQFITDIVVVADRNRGRALGKIPAGYKFVCLNTRIDGVDDGVEYLEANRGAHGDYIYIGYQLGTNMSKAIGDIKITEGSVPNYVHKSVDLNKGSGGKYIYLNYRYATSDENPITAISGYYASQYSLPAGWENPSSKMDLNKGAGGEYIYLILRR